MVLYVNNPFIEVVVIGINFEKDVRKDIYLVNVDIEVDYMDISAERTITTINANIEINFIFEVDILIEANEASIRAIMIIVVLKVV